MNILYQFFFKQTDIDSEQFKQLLKPLFLFRCWNINLY